MADVYSVIPLSGSVDGKGIKVTGITTGASVLVHTATSAAGDLDLVTIYAVNNDADGETRTLTLEWGGTTDPDNLIITPVPCKIGLVPITVEAPIMNSLVIRAFADEVNDVILYGSCGRVVN